MQEDIVVVSDDSAVGSDTAKELAELKMMLRKQDAEMEKLRSQLAATEIEKRKEEMIPGLSLEEIERFLKKERVTVWMKDMSEVLKNYVAAVPNPCRPTDVGGRQGQQLSLGDALAYRVWKVLNVAHSAYVKRYSHGEKSGPKGASETFEQAMAAGGDAWRYKSIQFKRKDGVAYWLSKAGDWIPVDASPSEDCGRCAAAGKTENLRHWCFRCPLCS